MKAKQQPVTIAGHIAELRMRLFWCAGALLIFTGVGFSIQEKLLNILQKPLHDTLYYTSPTGGFSFIFKIAISFGFVLTLPIITYHAIRFISPAFHLKAKTVAFFLLFSTLLAIGGVAFAYFLSLPAALKFLTSFGGDNITALITADEYFNFALAYVLGFAALFQLPLIISIIDKISPLTPKKMMRAQRYLILGSFIIAAILTPTPDPLNQTLMAAPIVILYQFAVIWIWIKSMARPSKNKQPARQRPSMPLPDPVEPPELAPSPRPQPRRPVLSMDGMAAPRRNPGMPQHRPLQPGQVRPRSVSQDII